MPPPAETPARSIVWLASYPKSGNTWLRAVLTSYLAPHGEPFSINALIGGPLAASRERFDDHLGLASSDMTPDEILNARPGFHRWLAAQAPKPTWIKVHDACLPDAGGEPLFPADVTAGTVYLVRNPLDVAVSYAHHRDEPLDRTIEHMNRAGAVMSRQSTLLDPALPQPLLTWSGHVTSWLRAARWLPLHVVRYEDMVADPAAAFGEVVRFGGLERDVARLAHAVEQAAFARLRAQEAQHGFDEKQPTAPSFFRAGAVGSWRSALVPRQVRRLVDAHGPVMERFGYLGEAEAFLARGHHRTS